MSLNCRSWLTLCAVLLASCSLTQPPPFSGGADDTVASAPAGAGASLPPQVTEQAPLKPAAAALIDDAELARLRGDYAQAAAALERAVRIDADHPASWLALARLRLAEGDLRQSENLARRAANLALPDSALKREAVALLAEIQRRPR